MPEITVYTTPGCVQCRPTKTTLKNAGVPFTEIDVTRPGNAAHAQHLKELGYLEAPVVMTSYGDEWSGFRPDLLAVYIAAWKEAQSGKDRP